jgi:flagellar FliJ protein
MAKPFHLQALIELAEERRQNAALVLARLKLGWQEAERKLQQLQGYLQEYQQRLQQQASSGFSIVQWRDYQAFMHKLELAIMAQSEEMERCRQRWELGQREWLERERELKAYQTLKQRHEQAERKIEDRLDQRLQDEFARDLHSRKLTNNE